MKDIRPIRGKFHIARLISEGEHENQDFKFQISDAIKIARSISAFANHSGGRLLIGVKDNGVISGVRSEEDIYVVEQAASLYCRPAVDVKFTAYKATDEGAVVIVADIPPHPRPPVKARESDGIWRAFYRVADENILASPLMVRAWQRCASPSALSIPLSHLSSTLFDIISSRGFATPEMLMHEASVSKADAEECIVSMVAIDTLQFVYRNGCFVAVRNQNR